MKVTLLIAAYDRPTLLGREIKTIIGQTFQDWQMVILDEYEGDHNQKVVEIFNDPRILIKKVRRVGDWGYSVKEEEVPNIMSEYVCFGNDDNEYDAHFFEKMINELDKGFDLVICDFKWHYKNYEVVSAHPGVMGVDLGSIMIRTSAFPGFGNKGACADGEMAAIMSAQNKWSVIHEPLFTHN